MGMFRIVTDDRAAAKQVRVSTAKPANITAKACGLVRFSRRCTAPIILSTKGVIATAQLNRTGRNRCCRARKPAKRDKKEPHCPAANGVVPAQKRSYERLLAARRAVSPFSAGKGLLAEARHVCTGKGRGGVGSKQNALRHCPGISRA